MLNNIVATATLLSGCKVVDRTLVFYAMINRVYVTKDKKRVSNPAMCVIQYRGNDVDDLNGLLAKGNRVAFKGVFTGDYYIRDAEKPNKKTVNGATIQEKTDGTSFACFEIFASELQVVDERERSWKEVADIVCITFFGRIGRDGETKYSDNGVAFVNTSIPSNYSRPADQEGEWDDWTVWFNLTTFPTEKQIRAIERDWKKGNMLVVQGTLSVENGGSTPGIWTTRDGDKRASYKLVVDDWKSFERRGAPTGDVDAEVASVQDLKEEDIPF